MGFRRVAQSLRPLYFLPRPALPFIPSLRRIPQIPNIGLCERRYFFTAFQPKKIGVTMTKTARLGLCLLLGGAVLTVGKLTASDPAQAESREAFQFVNTLNAKVVDVLTHSSEVPGLKAEEFLSLKEGVAKAWGILVRHGVLEVSGTDKEIRPTFVALQGVVEHVLSHALQTDVRSLKGIIHTPMPATPLCSKGEVSKDLVDPSVEKDPKRLFTVKARTTIVRDFLHQGGELHIVYPKGGMEKRTIEQQDVYKEELSHYPDRLLDRPLDSSTIPEEHIGATYFFTDKAGQVFVFAIKMTQAKDPKDLGHFGLWFGSLDNPAVSQKVKGLLSFINMNGVKIGVEGV